MDLFRVGRGKEALNGSKSNSSTKFPLALHQEEEKLLIFLTCTTTEWVPKNTEPYLPSTSSSLKRRYSAGRSSSTTSKCKFTRRYSQTPGLGRTARATKGGSTMASYTTKTNQMKKIKLTTKAHKIYLGCNTPDKENTNREKITCVDLKTSPKAPSCSFFLFSSGISSNSAMTWWCCRIPLPLASSLLSQQDC